MRVAILVLSALFAGAAAARGEDATISEIVPRSVAPGETFEIRGSGLAPSGGVIVRVCPFQVLGEPECRSLEVVSAADDRIVARIGRTGGALEVYAKGGGLLVETDAFGGVGIARPAPTSVAPAAAGPGDVVTVTGGAFGARGRRSRVRIGGRAAPIVSWAKDEIVVRLPRGAADGVAGVQIVRADGADGALAGVLDVTGATARAPRADGVEASLGVGPTRRYGVRTLAYDADARVLDMTARRRGTRDAVIFDTCILGLCFGRNDFQVRTRLGFDLRLPLDPAARTTIRAGDPAATGVVFAYEALADAAKPESASRSPVVGWTLSVAPDGRGRAVGTFSGFVNGALVEGRFALRTGL
jgi:hypothetical protein